MAPDGYIGSALKYNSAARTIGISLPSNEGHKIVFLNSSRSTDLYYDITMFPKEFDVNEVSLTHPKYASFSAERPFLSQNFDLVICDVFHYNH
jgi:hypothetical protein